MNIISVGFECGLELHPAGKGPWCTGCHYMPRLSTLWKGVEEKEMEPSFRQKGSSWVTGTTACGGGDTTLAVKGTALHSSSSPLGSSKALQNETREMKLSGLGRERGDVLGSCLGGKTRTPDWMTRVAEQPAAPRTWRCHSETAWMATRQEIQEKGQCPCTRVPGEILLTQTGKRSDFWTAGQYHHSAKINNIELVFPSVEMDEIFCTPYRKKSKINSQFTLTSSMPFTAPSYWQACHSHTGPETWSSSWYSLPELPHLTVTPTVGPLVSLFRCKLIRIFHFIFTPDAISQVTPIYRHHA